MSLTNTEFRSILADTSKRVEGTINWSRDEDHSPSLEFRVEVQSSGGWPLFIRGSYNRLASSLTYALILKSVGRIYGLDLGKDHHNPECTQVGDKHKHKWNESCRDKEAYVPNDITAPVTDPVGVWREFCVEARIKHNGTMELPSLAQEHLWL